MKWSLKLGRFLGIDVYIHFTFFLLLGFIGVSGWMSGGAAAAASGVLFTGSIFLCVLLHEYGHSLMARRYGIPTRDITLLPIGGVAKLERMPDKPVQELWVALAGPAVNVAIAGLLALWITLTGSWQPLSAIGPVEGSFAERLLAMNLFLVLFNMLPAFPMDGGRVLRALLAMKLEYARATKIAATIGKVMAGVFAIGGLTGSPMLLLIALFVWMGATQESAATQMKAGLHGCLVRDAMVTDFVTIRADDTVCDLGRTLLAVSQQDFPVVNHDKVIGIVAHEDILNAIQFRSPETLVSDIMRTEFSTVEEGELLNDALPHLHAETGASVPVMRRGHLVGMLTLENLAEFSVIREAFKGRTLPPPLFRGTVRFTHFNPHRTPAH